VPTFVDRGVSRGQRGGSPTVINLHFLDREVGHQKSKRLSYTVKFKHEVVWCTEEKGNHKAAVIFGVDGINIQLWWKHMAVISKCEASQKKFTGPKKGQVIEIDDAVLMSFQETPDWNKLYCTVLMACTAALSFFQNPALDRESDQHMILTSI
jgi:hypothetical protein